MRKYSKTKAFFGLACIASLILAVLLVKVSAVMGWALTVNTLVSLALFYGGNDD